MKLIFSVKFLAWTHRKVEKPQSYVAILTLPGDRPRKLATRRWCTFMQKYTSLQMYLCYRE